MSDTVLTEAEALAEPFEGFVAHPYLDPAKVWTIGFGSTRDVSGKPVTAHTSNVTVDQARTLAMRDMRAALQAVDANVTVPLTDDEEAALTDFVYNLGVGNFAHSTLLRKLNAGDYAGAALEFAKWDMAGGRVLAGLSRRRAAEKALFVTP